MFTKFCKVLSATQGFAAYNPAQLGSVRKWPIALKYQANVKTRDSHQGAASQLAEKLVFCDQVCLQSCSWHGMKCRGRLRLAGFLSRSGS
jgi:hypothetical protein